MEGRSTVEDRRSRKSILTIYRAKVCVSVHLFWQRHHHHYHHHHQAALGRSHLLHCFCSASLASAAGDNVTVSRRSADVLLPSAITEFVMCSRHEQLPHVIGIRPQWATTNVRQKATVVCEVRGSRSNKRLMYEPRMTTIMTCT